MKLIVSPEASLVSDGSDAWFTLRTAANLDRVYRLNAASVVMMCLCDGSRTREQVVKALCDWYQERDVSDFRKQAVGVLANALSAGLIRRTAASENALPVIEPDSMFEFLQNLDMPPVIEPVGHSALSADTNSKTDTSHERLVRH